MMEQPIEGLSLKNKLTLEIYDQSKKIAGDRWQVSLVGRIDIPVPGGEPLALKNGDTVSGTELKEALGETVRFEYKTERNFVDDNEKEACFNELKTSFLKNTKAYLAHDDFQRSFILKKYREHLASKRLYT